MHCTPPSHCSLASRTLFPQIGVPDVVDAAVVPEVDEVEVPVVEEDEEVEEELEEEVELEVELEEEVEEVEEELVVELDEVEELEEVDALVVPLEEEVDMLVVEAAVVPVVVASFGVKFKFSLCISYQHTNYWCCFEVGTQARIGN